MQKLEINQPMDPLFQSDTYAQVSVLNIITNEQLNSGTRQNIVSPDGPHFMYHKRGQTKVGRGKGCHWSIWGQLPEDDGQGSCHQDVWQTQEDPH